ncbi:hypothetical protein [Cyclobacterium jeungdonense]|uniref:O-antigen ligase-like membrane protein n=1 Tax=Cyclobacterium jeungdonense TaxID=708087 RepID=A0ABT8C7V1_9BACT|nr:hypothetical protein [Cyclobacterium jeungdonense]MDN3688868.1 hypothetical protein [Cyclobacterium jeungdonense]
MNFFLTGFGDDHFYSDEKLSRSISIKGYDSSAQLKLVIFLYFLLLIFEGALRKWFLPGLATPLLIVRDPLALWLVLKGVQRGLLPFTPYLLTMVFVGFISVYTAIFFGHGNLMIALYGSRIFLIHFPLMFVIGSVLTQEDIIKYGKFILLLSILMAVLIAFQFYSPQSHWVNRGVGGDMEGAGFGGALGYFRPPGTFSFTNGTALFFSLSSCFILYFWVKTSEINILLLIGATVALITSIPLSISRGLFFQVLVSLIFMIVALSRNPRYLGRLLLIGIIILTLVLVLSQTEIFNTATMVFFSRFEDASRTEGGLEGTLGDRFLGGLLSAILNSTKNPFFGHGLGLGSNVASALLIGDRSFLIAEEEWARTIGELGAVLGLTVIFVRAKLSFKIALASFYCLKRGNILPWMLSSFGVIVISQGQWAQPTALGFSTFIGGLIISTFNKSSPHQINKN